jgi:DNA-binding transcriptional MerR regulator
MLTTSLAARCFCVQHGFDSGDATCTLVEGVNGCRRSESWDRLCPQGDKRHFLDLLSYCKYRFMRYYSLEDLAKRTGVSVRAIRHYIARDLMRGPDTRGRNARYSDYHLARLHEIQRLKRRDRKTLAEIRAMVMEPTAGSGTFVMEGQKMSTIVADPPYSSGVTAGVGSGKTHTLLHAWLQQTSRHSAVKRTRATPWSRIPITADVELLVNARLSRRITTALEELAGRLRLALLSRHVSPGTIKPPPQRRRRI